MKNFKIENAHDVLFSQLKIYRTVS